MGKELNTTPAEEQKISSKPRRYQVYVYAIILLSLSLLLRVTVYPRVEPRVMPDSVEYINLSKALRDFDLSPFYRRPPGYPMVLAIIFSIAGKHNLYSVIAVQMVLSLFVPVLIFLIFLRVSSRRVFAFLCGLFVCLDIYLLGWDTAVLTESLATFLIVVGILVYLLGIQHNSVWLAVGADIVFALLGLTRALFSALFIVIALVSLIWILRYRDINHYKKSLRNLIIFFSIGFFVIFLWSLRNFFVYGMLGVSTSVGCNLTNLTGEFFEDVPTKNRQEEIIKRLYLIERERGGTHFMTIWRILPEMESKLKLTEPQISRIILRMSLRAAFRQPGKYLTNVLKSWAGFWAGRLTFYFSPQAMRYIVRNPVLGKIFYFYEEILLGSRFVHKYLPVLFLIMWLVLAFLKKKEPFPLLGIMLMGCTVLYSALISSVVEMGENPRYRTPVEPFILSLIFLGIMESINRMGQSLKTRKIKD